MAAVALGTSLIAAACGGDGGGNGSGNGNGGNASPANDPTPGGTVVYGLEAENGGGWCLPEGQLAIAGIQVARAIYDTLTMPNAEGEYKPFLASSVEPNEDYTVWTIGLREGIKFHDGTDLDAEVVKNNLDAYRGVYEGRTSLLFAFVLSNITDVSVVDPMTVQVTTEVPWPSFDAYLFASGRLGIMAQAQLDDPTDCDKQLIGTGPFKFVSWEQNARFVAEKNEDYWLTDADGNQLPYLDGIEFVPMPEASARLNSLFSGDLNALHTSGPSEILQLQIERDNGAINLVESDEYAEVSYGMFNVSRPPFNNVNARLAVAHGINRAELNDLLFEGSANIASGPFGPGEIGHLEDAGFPEYDEAKAQEYLAAYEAETGEPLSFTLAHANDANTTRVVQYLQSSAKDLGVEVNLKPFEQAALINTALGGDYDALTFRNHPGGNPDGQYIWWKSGMPTNFGRINDPDIDRLLDEGRVTSDTAERAAIYEELNRVFGEQVYNLWLYWTQWDVATADNVWGVYGPPLPDGGGEPFPGLAAGHSVAGMWIEQ